MHSLTNKILVQVSSGAKKSFYGRDFSSCSC